MLGKIKLGPKVILGFILLSGAFLLFGLYSSITLRNSTNFYQETIDHNMVPLVHLTDAEMHLDQVAVAVRGLLALMAQKPGTPRYSEIFEVSTKSIDEYQVEFYKETDAYIKMTNSPDRKKTVEEIVLISENYFLETGKILQQIKTGHTEDLVDQVMFGTLTKIRKEVSEKLETVQKAETEDATKIGARLQKETALTLRWNYVLILLACCFAGVLGWVIHRDVSRILSGLISESQKLVQAAIRGELLVRGNVEKINFEFRPIVDGMNKTLDALLAPIAEAGQVLEKMSRRDLTVKVVGDYHGNHADIKNNLNLAVENLQEALNQVADAIHQVSTASTQISAGSQSLALGSNKQAASLDNITTSLQKISEMVKQNLSNTTQANRVARAAKEHAEKGNVAMLRMDEAIDKIKSSAQQTAKILKTIDEIAFQTNLLALNAAVEAARAGESGRGFAVVAEEVRSLAQRSAEAAKNTSALIEESQKNAAHGVEASREVAAILSQIVGGAQQVAQLISEISEAAEAQTKGVEQIHRGVSELNGVTQQNSSLSEESASSAEELSAQSSELADLIGQFHLQSEQTELNMDQIAVQQASSKAGGQVIVLRPKSSNSQRSH